MTTKQVKKAIAVEAVVASTSISQNLFISVRTFDVEGKPVGERIVDMCHYGTRDWLSKHLWWATHHGYCTEVNIATPEESADYVAKGREALAAKFNAPAAEVIAEAA